MAKQKKPVHRVQMTEGKRNIIHQFLEEYDIETAEDIQDALKDLLGGTIKEMMEAEMDEHLGYGKSERSDSDDYRNGYKRKRVNSSYGAMEIDVPQDRKSTFEPQVVKKRQKDISDIDQKIISMYAKGMTTRQISETIEDIYGFETSEGFISDVTDKILPQIEDWQNRPLDDVYPILYIDAIHYSVRDNGVIRKLAAYVILGINMEGKKEVLTISVGDNESAKYWLSVMNELKNRGVKDVLIICADGLTGIKEAIAAAFPKTEYQRCIVHQVRNTLKYVPDKDRKAFATDLKTIYQAADEKKALVLPCFQTATIKRWFFFLIASSISCPFCEGHPQYSVLRVFPSWKVQLHPDGYHLLSQFQVDNLPIHHITEQISQAFLVTVYGYYVHKMILQIL